MQSIEGLIEKTQVPPIVKYAYPLVKEKEKDLEQLRPKVAEFLSRDFQTFAYVAFGSTAIPSMNHVKEIKKMIQENTHIGFVVSLIEHEQLQMFQDLRNAIAFSWVQQRELLQSGKISVYFAHGGFNSILDSMKVAIPQIITPVFPSD